MKRLTDEKLKNYTVPGDVFNLCNLCRRCAQTCPIGADNGLVAHELRKLFSQEMGIAAKELHDTGSMLQLKVGSSTGMNAEVVKDNIAFIDEDISEKTAPKYLCAPCSNCKGQFRDMLAYSLLSRLAS